MAKKSDLIGYVYRYRKYLAVLLLLFMPVSLFLLYMNSPLTADTPEDVYSIYIIAGQSQAEGSNTRRDNLPNDSTGFDKYSDVADAQTKFWWAGAAGARAENIIDFFKQFYPNSGIYSWSQSGGSAADSDPNLRMTTLESGQTQPGILVSPQGQVFNQVVGPEFGIARSLYRDGRRKVVILKVSYGFQSLFMSNSSAVPFDWNTEHNCAAGVVGQEKSYCKLKAEYSNLTSYIKNELGAKYTVDGFFWNQGGTDTIDPAYTDDYQRNFTNLVNAVKTDFQLHPDAHMVAAKIGYQWCVDYSYPLEGNYCGLPWGKKLEPNIEFVFDEIFSGQTNVVHPRYVERLNKVRDSIQNVADFPQNDWVDTMEIGDQPRSNDNLHYNEVGQLNIGERFTKMYRMPYRVDGANYTDSNGRVRTSTDFDGDGILNVAEDTGDICDGRPDADPDENNGNLGDDDCDGDGYPNYLDALPTQGSGL